MYLITGRINYPYTNLISVTFYCEVRETEPTKDDLKAIRDRLREEYKGEPFAKLISVQVRTGEIADWYVQEYPDKFPGISTSDARKCYFRDWKSHKRPPGVY